jgi:hypothetical protein
MQQTSPRIFIPKKLIGFSPLQITHKCDLIQNRSSFVAEMEGGVRLKREKAATAVHGSNGIFLLAWKKRCACGSLFFRRSLHFFTLPSSLLHPSWASGGGGENKG